MKKTTIILSILLWHICSYAQEIVAGEYFIDTEPGVGNGTPINVTPSADVEIDLSISASGLSVGFHHLHTRFQMDNGQWGLLHTKMFYVVHEASTTLETGEYFIDTEPGLGNGIPINISPSSDVSVDLDVSVSGLSPGFHHLYVRFKMMDGQWGLLHTKMFYVLPIPADNSIVSGEYFIDTDPGVGMGAQFTLAEPTDSVDTNFSFLMPELSLGQHFLYIRYKTQSGDWGMLERRSFTVCTDYGSLAKFSFTTLEDVAFFYNEAQHANQVKWDFGDGTISTEINPSHLYDDAGVYQVKLATYNECANDSIIKTIEINGIKDIIPNHSANTNFILATISGVGFSDNMEVKLIRIGEEHIGYNVNSNGSNSLNANFNMENETIGLWDIVVTAPGVYSDTLLQAFDMQPPVPTNISTYVSSPQRVLTGRHQRVVVNVTNEGNKTEIGLQHFVRFPKTNIRARLLTEMKAPSLQDHLIDSLLSGLRTTLDPISGDSIYSGYYVIPILGPGETTTLVYDIYAVAPSTFNISSVIGKSIFTEEEKEELINGETNVNASVIETFVARSLDMPFSELFSNHPLPIFIRDLINGVLSNSSHSSLTPALPNTTFLNPTAFVYTSPTNGCAGCGQQGIPSNPGGTAPISGSMQAGYYIFETYEPPNEVDPWELTWEEFLEWLLQNPETEEEEPAADVWEFTEEDLLDSLDEDLGNDVDEDLPENSEEEAMEFTEEELCAAGFCDPIVPIDDNVGKEEDKQTTHFVTSIDPNIIHGPIGFTTDQYIHDNIRMNYLVEFENADTAQANAAVVEILLPLDTSVFDISTFRFETFGFSEALYNLAPYRNAFTAELSIENLHPCIVRITGFMPDSAGLVRILLESLDFETRNWVNAADEGFLPPNINAPEGQGFITYSIRQKENLPSLTEIDAFAEIVFDSNDGIITNLHKNIVDADNPSSTILPLEVVEGNPMLTLHFDKQDGESGVDFLDVYISINSGAFQRITRTNSDSALFQMTIGNTYSFYTVATDFCGNREEDTGLADITISYNEINIVENDISSHLYVFPVPAKGQVMFELKTQQAASINFEVTDMTGKTVVPSKRMNAGGNTFRQQIDISELAAGVYLLDVRIDEEHLVRKLIVQ